MCKVNALPTVQLFWLKCDPKTDLLLLVIKGLPLPLCPSGVSSAQRCNSGVPSMQLLLELMPLGRWYSCYFVGEAWRMFASSAGLVVLAKPIALIQALHFLSELCKPLL